MFSKISNFVKNHKLLTFIAVIIVIFLVYVYCNKGNMTYYQAIKSTVGFSTPDAPFQSMGGFDFY